MENHEREYFVSQIIYGAKMMDFRDKTLIVQPPTMEQNYVANRVFKKVYDEALLSGIYTRNEMLEIMIEQGVWSQEEEDQIEKNKKTIEDIKLQIYKSFFNSQTNPKLKKRYQKHWDKAEKSKQKRLAIEAMKPEDAGFSGGGRALRGYGKAYLKDGRVK